MTGPLFTTGETAELLKVSDVHVRRQIVLMGLPVEKTQKGIFILSLPQVILIAEVCHKRCPDVQVKIVEKLKLRLNGGA